MSDPRFRDGRGHRVTELEKRTAVADVRCKKEVDLINIWATVETTYQRIAISQNKQDLAAAKALLDTKFRSCLRTMILLGVTERAWLRGDSGQASAPGATMSR